MISLSECMTPINKDMKIYSYRKKPRPPSLLECANTIFLLEPTDINHQFSVLTSEMQEDMQILCVEASVYNFFVLSNYEYFPQLLSLSMSTSEPSRIFAHRQSPGAELGWVSTLASFRGTMALSLSCTVILLDMVLNFL